MARLRKQIARLRAGARGEARQPASQQRAVGGDRRVHERREVVAAEPDHPHRRARGERPVRHPRHRRAHEPRPTDGRVYTLVDTVGFVRNLPHQLVEAFRSTLEEVRDCDIIVHVVDASHPDPAGQLATVRGVIGELEARSIPEIVVFNKADLVSEDERLVLRGLEPKAVFTSAHTGEGIDELLERIAQLLPKPSIRLELLVPYDRGEVISALHDARPHPRHVVCRRRHHDHRAGHRAARGATAGLRGARQSGSR